MNKEQKVSESETKKKPKVSLIAIANRVILMLILASGILYLAGTNDLAIKHFVVQEKKRHLYSIKDDNTQLESKVMALSSFSTINKKVASLKLVKADNVDYINLVPTVAKR